VGKRQKAKGIRQKWEVGAQRLAASQRWASLAFYLLLFAFQGALDDMGDEDEQRQTLNALVKAIDEEPLSPRRRFRQ